MIGNAHNDRNFAIIAGPCSAESPEQVLECAQSLTALGISTMRCGIWKPRTRPGSYEGPGDEGLQWLAQAKAATGIRSAVEVASAHHVQAALEAGIDVLWIGARTTTSPFAMQEIADSLRDTDIPVWVKNPVNPDIDLWTGAIERLADAGLTSLGAIHRGFSSPAENVFRYSPLWEIPIELRRRMPGLPILCDPSHMAGCRDLIQPLSQMALDLNADGLFVEVHPDPKNALSDSAQQLTPKELATLLDNLTKRHGGMESDLEALRPLRDRLDELDRQLVEILSERMNVVRKIGLYKRAHNMAILQPERYRAIHDKAARQARDMGIPESLVNSIFETIHAESVRYQLENDKKNKRL